MLMNGTTNETRKKGASIFVKIIVSICFFLAAAQVGLGIALAIGPWMVNFGASKISEIIVDSPSRDPGAYDRYDLLTICGCPFYPQWLLIGASCFVFIALVSLLFRRKEARVYRVLHSAAGFAVGIYPILVFGDSILGLVSLLGALTMPITSLVASPFVASRIALRLKREKCTENLVPNEKERLRDVEAILHVAGFVLGIYFIVTAFSFSFCV